MMYSQDGKLDADEALTLDIISRKARETMPSIRTLQGLECEGLVEHTKDENGYGGALTEAGLIALKAHQESQD